MFSKPSIIGPYIKHSTRILFRYQQIYGYILLIIALILMPLFFGIKKQYLPFLVSLNYLIVLWLLSPFILNMFSFSSEDARSLSLFPVKFKYLVAARNILNFCLLIVAFGLSVIIIALFYPKTNITVTDLIVLSLMHLLSTISIGNFTSGSSLSWIGITSFSWKSIYVILVLNFNVLFFQISKYYFNQSVFILIIATSILIYIGFYYISFQKIVREISIYISSIAEK